MRAFNSINKNLLIGLIAMVLFNPVVAQQDFKSVLDQIVSNNSQISASKKATESQIIEAKREILPENPEFEFEYLPSATDRNVKAQKMNISQSIDFPTVYLKKKNWIDAQERLLQAEQKAFEQELRLAVSDQLIRWVFLQKQANLLNQRFSEVKNLLTAYQNMFEAGEVNILKVNQVRIRHQKILQEKRNMQTVILTAKEDLKAFNGGQEITPDILDYPALSIIDPDSEWITIQSTDQRLVLNGARNSSATQHVKVQQHAYLPELKLGYGSEKTPDEHFRGVVFGMSIPLWGKANTVKQAKMEADAVKDEGFSIEQIIKSEYLKARKQAVSTQKSKEELQQLIQAISQKELLDEMLNTGSISLTDYLVELESYYELQNQFILLESELFDNLNVLNRYKY